MKKISAGNYRKDKLYGPVSRAVAALMQRGEVVSPVNVLLQMGRLDKQQYEDWRFGRVAYLERVIRGNLGQANRVLRILRCHAESLQLKPAKSVYRKWGKGRRHPLRFSKSGHPNIERAYAVHYLTRRQTGPKISEPSAEGNHCVRMERQETQAAAS